MNKYSKLIVIAVAVSLVSCSQPEPTPKELMEESIEKYLYSLVEEETNGSKEVDLVIVMDSVEVLDSITLKKELGYQLLKMQKDAVELTEEGKELKKQYQDKKNLAAMYSDASGVSNDAYIKTVKDDLESLNKQYKERAAQASEMLQKMNELEKEMTHADSTTVMYYHVIAHYKAVDNKSGKEKKAYVPFHISPKYEVLRDAKAILGDK